MNGEWPEQPSLRFLIHWALRREELCDPKLVRMRRMTAAAVTTARSPGSTQLNPASKGQLIRRALDLRAALKLGVGVSLDEIAADEFYTMLLVEEERDRLDREQLSPHGRR